MSTTDTAMSFREALGLHRQDRLDEAATAYQRVLDSHPGHPGAAHLLGTIRLQRGDSQGAAQLLRLAIQSNPLNAEPYSDLGSALQALGLLQEALISLDRALELKPTLVAAHHNRGGVLYDLGRMAEAIASFDRAIALHPELPPAHYCRARALLALKRLEEALEGYERALRIAPGYIEALNDRGIVLLELGRPDEALASLDAALAHNPRFTQALNNRGNALRRLLRQQEALACFDRALAEQPAFFEALRNRAGTLRELGRLEAALEGQAAALRIRPDDVDTLRDRVETLLDLKRYEPALERLEALQLLAPDADYLPGLRLHLKHALCDWSSYAQRASELVTAVKAGRHADYPFPFLAVTDDAATQLQCARSFVSHKFPSSPEPLAGRRGYRHERIRVAYLSGDLRFHVVSSLLAGVFEHHDRARFELTAISFRPAEDSSMGRRVRTAFESFIDVSGSSDREVARLMSEREIDIAVDLMGFTQGSRTGVLAQRPAPVQVNYLGYPGTMGAPYIDYLVADPFLVPAQYGDRYAEKIAYLPDCFQANDDRRFALVDLPSRESLGLPESAFVWCCFNNSFKVNPRCFDIWMRLLQGTPNSVLWLLAETATVERNLRHEASTRGVDADRLVFARRVSYGEHLARLQRADLFLDTLPFNGGITASDVLWAGLPVLTCAGEAYAARMAGSLLHAIGLPELVSHNASEYEARAFELARTPALLKSLRDRLAENRSSRALFDTATFSRHLEAAYQRMWERAELGLPPESFNIESVGGV